MGNKQKPLPLLVGGLPERDIGRIIRDMGLQENSSEITSRNIVGNQSMGLFEKALKLQLEALSFAAKNMSKWGLSDGIIAAMAARVFNHLRASLKALLAGYWAESLVLERSAHEAMSRELFFYFYPERGKQFFEGMQIKQEEVDKKLAQRFTHGEGHEASKEIYDALRKSYKKSSEISHPNLLAIQLQTLSDSKDDVGSKTILGPIIYQDMISVQFAGLLALALSATRILALVGIHQATNTWRSEYEELEGSANSLFSSYGFNMD
jgi:hypothetical protein